MRALLERGCERICLYSRGEYAQFLMRQEFGDDSRLRWMVGDVRDPARLRRSMRGIDCVIHAAALKRVEVGRYNPSEVVSTNVVGTQNVIEAAADAGVSRAVFVSSDKAVEPTNIYGCSKAMGEHLWAGAMAMSLGPVYGAVRFGNIAGSTGSVIPTWRAAIGAVEVRDPEVTRFWITQKDAAELVMRAIESDAPMLVPDLPAYRLGDLAEAMGINYYVTRLEGGEKPHESMSPGWSSDKARRMTVHELRTALESV